MTIVEPDLHDLAVIARLQAIPGGHPVGYAKAPDGALGAVLDGTGPDYMILYPLTGSTLDGSIADPYADARFAYQITVVGFTAEGVRWLVGQIPAALATVAIAGRSVTQIVPDDLGAVREDRDVVTNESTGVLIATPRYSIHTTPA